MSWQKEIVDLLAYGRRIGLGFDEAWREAVACVELPALVRGRQRQLELGGSPDQSVLEFFREMCRQSWDGGEVAPAGWHETVLDSGGQFGHGASRGVSV